MTFRNRNSLDSNTDPLRQSQEGLTPSDSQDSASDIRFDYANETGDVDSHVIYAQESVGAGLWHRAASTIDGESGPLATPKTTLSIASDDESATSSAPTARDPDELDDGRYPNDPDSHNAHLSNPIESVCLDGDLLLNIRSESTKTGTNSVNSPIAPIILKLRVSSAVLRIASAPLKALLDIPASNTSGANQWRRLIFYRPSQTHPPRFWGYREGGGTFSIVVNSTIPTDELRQSMLLLFQILHHNNNIHQCRTPNLLQVTWVAEIAWVLRCIAPIVPWIKSWLSGLIPVDMEVQLVSRVVLGFVLGDSEVFNNASRQLLLHPLMWSAFDPEYYSLVVVPLIVGM